MSEALPDGLVRDIAPLPGGLAGLRARLADEQSGWDAVAREVTPLPGGLAGLRTRLREPRRVRFVPVAFAGAIATAIALLLTTHSAPAHADRAAMKQLLAGGGQPNPGAAAMGLVDAATPIATADPRVADQVVVFRWVSPRPSE
jgi:hypothetical protein